MKGRMLVASGSLMALFLLAPRLAVAQNHYRLARDWEAHLGPAKRVTGMAYRLATCPGGTSHLTDGLGRVVSVDTQGRVLADEVHHEVEGVHATACGDSGRLIAAVRSSLVMGHRFPGGTWLFAPRVEVSFIPSALAVARDGSIFALGPERDGNYNQLHRLGPMGTAMSKFGPLVSFRRPNATDRDTARDLWLGSLLLDEERGRVAVVSMRSYELHEFDFAGGRTGQRSRNDSLWRAPREPADGSPMEPGDEVTKVVRLPDGRLVARITRTSLTAPNVYATESYLEVLGEDFRPSAERVSLSGYGLLQGADAAGGLYFTNINPDGVRVARARLIAAH